MEKVFCKYIYLNGKNLLFGILSACFFGLIAFDSNKYYSAALLMVPSLLFSFVVGKMCYEEDPESTKEFLLSFPVLKRDLALEKNIVGQICIVVGLSIVNIMFFIINIIIGRTEAFINLNAILVMTCFLIIYNTIFIYLNYKFDYSKTQFLSYTIAALMFILFKFGNEFVSLIEGLNSYILIITVIVLSSISLFITRSYKWNL